ncbi:LytR C-terminal domain-containing protein [Streptacidiphilus sp. MAP5-3]|uniref:LCP family protein n=1 Tax=unclassified Streptacidiphilus TaxID=2643834 RepID=UPI0035174E81
MTGTADRRGPGDQGQEFYGGVPQQNSYEQGYQDPYTGEWVFPSQQQRPAQVQYGAQQGYEQPGHGQQGYAQPGHEQSGHEQGGYQQQPGYSQAYQQQPGYGQGGYGGEQNGYGGQQSYQGQDYYQDYGPADTGSFAPPVSAPQAPAQPQYTAEQQYRVTEPEPPAAPTSAGPAAPKAPGPLDDKSYTDDSFTFVDDEEEDSQDVIDWVKFSETRGERRDERRRKMRSRGTALLVALALIAVGGVGYLWATGKILSSSPGAVAASTQREVIAVHLHDLNKNVYSALLVSEPSSDKGVTMLLPGTLGIPQDSSSTLLPLSAAVDSQGTDATRTGINALLGTDVSGTWDVYEPFLQNLVDLVGGVQVQNDVPITVNGKEVATPGQNLLNGQAAMTYATYQGKGEPAQAQLNRFGQVLAALIKAMPTDPTSAATKIDEMGAVADPSFSDSQLGALLARLSTDARSGSYSTETLPVQGNGTLGGDAASMVSGLLAGKVKQNGAQVAARVQIVDASGKSNALTNADAAVTNGGFTLVPGGGKQSERSSSEITYTDDSRLKDAQTLANYLGLSTTAIKKVSPGSQSVDLLVVLGHDFKVGS